jgi:MFS family permease
LSSSRSHARPLFERASSYFVAEPSRERRGTSWQVLRVANFRWYFFGSVGSDFGTWMQNTAQVLLAYHLAHSVFAVGLVSFAQFSSPLVLGPWAGVMADRLGGRVTLICTQVTSALISLTLAAFALSGALTESWLITGAILGGLTFTFALPARNVTVQRLVDEKQTRAAYVMDAVSYNLGRALGPLVTLLIGDAGISYAWAFAANAGSFIAFAAVLWWAHEHGTEEPKVRSRVRDGFIIAGTNGKILVLLLMVAAVTVADDPILVLGPGLAMHLHQSPNFANWFIAALGAGSVCGSVLRPHGVPRLRLAVASLTALALFMIAFIMAPVIWISVAAAFGAGVSCLIANSATRTRLSQAAGQIQPGKDLVAAVMAVWAIAWAGSKPIASLADGLLGSHFGLAWTGLALAIPALIPGVVMVFMPGFGTKFANFAKGVDASVIPEPEPAVP